MLALLDFLIIPGGFFLGVALFVIGTVLIVRGYEKRIVTRSAWPWWLHVGGMVLFGSLAFVYAVSWGIAFFCTQGASTQCGLGGVFGTGPMAFGIAAFFYAGMYAVWDME